MDCTLRDGGYINQFNFGRKTIKKIIDGLTKAGVDIIECGFLQSGAIDRDCSLFNSVEAVRDVLPEKNSNLLYVAMLQYGKISIDEISEAQPDSIDGIRLSFHEHEIVPAIELGEKLKAKGYRLFMQAVGTTTYSDDALLNLVEKMNILKPFAFYLVDTLGAMYKKDLLRMFYMIDHNLDKRINIGFHSHNNLQLAFANAQELIEINTPRNLIVDTSVYGMGRGAGNLNTELVTQYINANIGLRYDNTEILSIIDEIIRPLSQRFCWGYDAAYYLASITGCHPNYASFLMNRQTLYAKDICVILNSLSFEKRGLYDQKYIGKIYDAYMDRHVDDRDVLDSLKAMIGTKEVAVLAPGKTLKLYSDAIKKRVKEGSFFVISVNFIPNDLCVHMMFISNMKRFAGGHDLVSRAEGRLKIVATSNIVDKGSDKMLVVDYASYLCEEQCISDNAGLMCINMLKRIGVSKVLLVGFDGFSAIQSDNYYDVDMILDVETERLKEMNRAIQRKISQLRTSMNIEFFASSAYQ